MNTEYVHAEPPTDDQARALGECWIQAWDAFEGGPVMVKLTPLSLSWLRVRCPDQLQGFRALKTFESPQGTALQAVPYPTV